MPVLARQRFPRDPGREATIVSSLHACAELSAAFGASAV